MIKAVVVGINTYKNYPNQTLAGCINDAEDILQHLTASMKVKPADITPLYDDRATKAAIVTALRDMIASASAGDHLLFHMSSHGTQIDADSVAEPDGLDEVLCPHDFTFTDRRTALTDDEIAGLFDSLPPQVAMTIVVDACHSGDIKKLLAQHTNPRFLRPPADVAWRLANTRVAPKKRLRAFVEGIAASACQSTETAADTSFNGRPNGAFTYYLLKALRATPTATLEAIVTETAKHLTTYVMHPQLDGSQNLRDAPFLDEDVFAARSKAVTMRGVRTLSAASKSVVLYENRWYASVLGVPISLGLAITRAGSTFNFELTPGVVGAVTRLTVPVDGNASIPIPASLLGQIVIDVGGWSLSPQMLVFDLTARVQPSLGFVPPITIVTQRISIPLGVELRAFDVPSTASELFATLALLRGDSPAPMPQPAPRAITAADNTPFATRSDKLEWGPNWSQDRAVMVGPLPHNQIRYGEPVFFNQSGAGQVSFVSWLNDDPTDGSFVCHIGNNFWGGWGSKWWQVLATYANIDIVFRDLPAPAPSVKRPRPSFNGTGSSNGHSHLGESVMLSNSDR
jgi:metacaspase-1